MSKLIHPSLINNSLIIFPSVNYVCRMSVVLWYLLIGLPINHQLGNTGTDMHSSMVALANWLQNRFSTNMIFHLKTLSSVYGIRRILMSNVSSLVRASLDLCPQRMTLTRGCSRLDTLVPFLSN